MPAAAIGVNVALAYAAKTKSPMMTSNVIRLSMSSLLRLRKKPGAN